MKKLPFLIISLIAAMYCFGQDGSDIIYIKPKKLDKSYIGRLAHLEFKNSALTNGAFPLTVQNNTVQFTDRRAGNEQGGLFYAQYAESAGYVNGYNIRLIRSRIEDVTGDSIQVTNYYDLYRGNALAAGKSIQQQYWFSKKMISQVLVKEDNKGM